MVGAAVGVEAGGKRDTERERERERERGWNLELGMGNVRLRDSSMLSYLFAFYN
jgi:hypothetical protein